MDRSYSQQGIVREIVRQETRFLRHYIGEVADNDDELARGRVKVKVHELGWSTPDLAAWCNPRELHRRSVPAVGEWVEVYFIAGDVNRPVYMGIATEIRDMTPAAFQSPDTHVLFESPDDNRMVILYDAAGNLLQLGSPDASESFVLGDTAKTELEVDGSALAQLQTDLTGWVPVPNDGGATLKTILSAGFLTKAMANYGSILSEKIKGE